MKNFIKVIAQIILSFQFLFIFFIIYDIIEHPSSYLRIPDIQTLIFYVFLSLTVLFSLINLIFLRTKKKHSLSNIEENFILEEKRKTFLTENIRTPSILILSISMISFSIFLYSIATTIEILQITIISYTFIVGLSFFFYFLKEIGFKK